MWHLPLGASITLNNPGATTNCVALHYC